MSDLEQVDPVRLLLREALAAEESAVACREVGAFSEEQRERIRAALTEGDQGVGAVLHYNGSFPLNFLENGEQVRAGNSPGEGLDGSCVIETPDYEVRVEPGDELVRGEDGELFARQPSTTPQREEA